MSIEQRKHPRLAVPMQVELTYENGDIAVLTTRDISDGGVFLEKLDGNLPALDSHVKLKVKATLAGEEPQTLDATVVRVSHDGVGIQFDDE